MKPYYIFLFLLISVPAISSAQNSGNINEINEKGVDEKFDFIYDESGDYRQYKVIEKSWMSTLKSQVMDTIESKENSISEAQSEISSLSKELESVENKLKTSQDDLEESRSEVDSISLFGIDLSKSFYKTIMWLLVLALLAIIVYMYFRFKNSHYVTQQSQQSLKKTQQEFEAFKKRSLEREQKLKREIMDLRNNG